MTATLDLMRHVEDGEAANEGFIPLNDPDISVVELDAINRVMRSARISSGPFCDAFERAFASYLGRKYAIAVPSGTIGLLLVLNASGIGPGHEVITSAFSYREAAQAISLAGAKAVFTDIDYWSGTIAADKIKPRITDKTRAILAGNTNGHPASWNALRDLATENHILLLEDSTEAIGSRYQGRVVGTFGDASVFDFAQPAALTCGEGGMVVTDDVAIAMAVRRLRSHRPADRSSVVAGGTPPYQACMSDIAAALGLAQLSRLDEILERRRVTENLYSAQIQSFEGIKPPYIAPDITEVNWFLYVVHLGTRFSRSSRDSIVEDLRTEQIEAAAYSRPLHLQRHYVEQGYRRGDLFVTEKLADRALALPFHTHLSEDQIAFIVQTMKDSSINIGAGSAIY